ncbi:hypothetical protein Mgra_00007731 [Meloidogyne graminicola]|uniref:Acid phosphatase n=1 Tax=Meloidogyne graminicola TaxID=189291 RepID=A0A8S9ZI10_9BILA|nr:hypothetical protein Mgra_00007731 [Meloidogyne graminicola]
MQFSLIIIFKTLFFKSPIVSMNSLQENLNSLKFVIVVWRHGDRTSTSLFPSDKENSLGKIEKKFGGLGQLTELGAFTTI